jgi:hypothetical protein
MKQETLTTGGVFTLKHYRDGELIHEESSHNIVPTEGLDYILNAAIRNTTDMEISTWYVSLKDNSGDPAAGNTCAQFYGTDGHQEFYDVTEATRPVWSADTPEAGSPSGRMVDNSTTNATFTVDTLTDSAGTIYGAAIMSTNVFSTANGTPGTNDSGGTLLAATTFTSRAVLAGDVLNVEYSLTATSS